jgi:hypothetical protein
LRKNRLEGGAGLLNDVSRWDGKTSKACLMRDERGERLEDREKTRELGRELRTIWGIWVCSGFHSAVEPSSWMELFQLFELFLLALREKTLVGNARERLRGESLGESMVAAVPTEGRFWRTMARAACLCVCVGEEEGKAG